MSDALRQVFAELGFNADTRSLDKANQVVDKAIAGVRKLIAATGAGDQIEAVVAARRTARAAVQHKQSVQAAADAEKAAGGPADKSSGFLAKLREVASADAKTKDDARKAELDLAHTLAAKAALGHKAPTSDPFGRSSKTDPKALGFGGKFGIGQWKVAEAKAKAVADRIEKAITGPVESLQGFFARTDAIVANTLGKAMPASVKKFSEKLGFAKGDTLALGAAIMDLSRKGAMGFAALVVGVAAFNVAFAAEAEALRETAREARVTSSELQQLQYAGMASGVGADRMVSSVTAFGQKLRDLNNRVAGSGGTNALLRRMGISARDASGQVRPTTDVLMDVGAAMEHIGSPRRRTSIARQLGIDPRMLDILHSGAGGLRAYMDEAREYGEGVTPEATEAARRFTVQQARLQRGFTSLRSSIFTQLSPSFEGLMQKGARLAGWFANITRGSHFFEIAATNLGRVLVVAAGPALIAWSPMIAMFVAGAAAVVLMSLAMDDVQNLMEGNNSLIGDTIDRYTHLGESARYVRMLGDAWDAVGRSADAAGAIFGRVIATIDRLPPVLQAVLFPLRTTLDLIMRATGRDGSQAAASAAAPALPDTPAAGARGGPAGPPNMPASARDQPMMPGLGSAAAEEWKRAHPDVTPLQTVRRGPKAATVSVPATRAVPMPGGGGNQTVQQTTTVQGDRNTFHINGNDVAGMRREVERLMDERERRRNADRSPREAQE